jgi:hypothetical protein
VIAHFDDIFNNMLSGEYKYFTDVFILNLAILYLSFPSRALQQHSDRLPEGRKQELEEMVTKYYGVDHMDGELLQRALTINAK